MMKKTFLTIATAAFAATTWAQTPQLRADNIDEVLQAMTLREKATLLVGELAANQNAQGTQIGNTERYIPGAAGNTYAIPRLGIPPTVMADGPAGLRIYTQLRQSHVLLHWLSHRNKPGRHMGCRRGEQGDGGHGQ